MTQGITTVFLGLGNSAGAQFVFLTVLLIEEKQNKKT